MKRTILWKTHEFWVRFWMHHAGVGRFGRIATWLATWFTPPYYGRCFLAGLNPKGYISPGATIYHDHLQMGKNVFIGDGVVIFRDGNGGPIEIGENVHIYGETFIQTGEGGSFKIGNYSHIHPRCQISAYLAPISIGSWVQIAPNCAFYPYNHGYAAGKRILDQPLRTRGGIVVEDGAWLGYGVIVLDGVRIGRGAVIGAGSVVTRDIPDGAIAAGVPSRVINMRRVMGKGSPRGGEDDVPREPQGMRA